MPHSAPRPSSAITKRPAHLHRRKPTFFHPVPLRGRQDGWTIRRQCAFLAQLYVTGSVAAAVRAVGISRMAAYRLRRCDGADGFARSWDRVLAPPGAGRMIDAKADWQKVTTDMVRWQAETGLVRPVIYRGVMTGIAHKADISAQLRLLRRLDRACNSSARNPY